MPVIRQHEPQNAPPWSEISHYGVNRLKAGDTVELHYHSCNEYWIIVSGRGTCTTEGDTYEIGAGDMVLTKAGDEHSLLVTEDMVAVYCYGIMPEGGLHGHLHRERGIGE
ncbi:cupin domain-containing protein [Paenibacillus lycopersici]|uniref:Cupin domain-containing protein n=1 Tax=Paenibacillus lycopersici TaxID=2704462 RepID=A0A6C0G5F6_9BACL|nr:cupin domain-containing protein [Paenibacillus lycopersici]QHT60275.1 cupin domain-containing protein [Paenibacillus lycopersici]